MTIIYITENNTKRYGVTFQNNEYVKVQKLKIFLTIKILYTKSDLWKRLWVNFNYLI